MTPLLERTRTRWTAEHVAFAWGLAEAVVFFVIPDVFLTLVAVRAGPRRAWLPMCWATAGAVLGGLLLYAWATLDPSSAWAVMELVPGIDAALISGVQADVAAQGMPAVFKGAWQGEPYKLFAAAAGDAGLSPMTLALLTVPARLARSLAIAIAGFLGRAVDRWIDYRVLVAGWALFWGTVYAAYWLS